MEINKNEATHLRKGIVGDWRNYFTEEQNKRFDDLYSQKMIKSSLKNNWDELILGHCRQINISRIEGGN